MSSPFSRVHLLLLMTMTMKMMLMMMMMMMMAALGLMYTCKMGVGGSSKVWRVTCDV